MIEIFIKSAQLHIIEIIMIGGIVGVFVAKLHKIYKNKKKSPVFTTRNPSKISVNNTNFNANLKLDKGIIINAKKVR
jgi:hypothetical protein